MTQELTIREIDGWQVSTIEGDEPRVRDVDLAERLGMKEPRAIRKLIERNREELEKYAAILQRDIVSRYESKPGIEQERTVSEYWLAEDQARCVSIMSRAPRAPEVRFQMIQVFRQVRTLAPAMLGLAEALQAGLAPLVEGLRETNTQIAESNRQIGTLAQGHVRLEQRVGGLEDRTAHMVKTLDRLAASKRTRPSQACKAEHAAAARAMGCLCPCCGVVRVVDSHWQIIGGAQIDHFWTVQDASVENTWLICANCHSDLTNKRVARTDRTAHFEAYQAKRQALPGAQVILFPPKKGRGKA